MYSETHKLIHEVRLPARSKLLGYRGDISNAPCPAAKFSFDNEDVVIWTIANPTGGDLSGELAYRWESPYGAPITLFVSSILLTLLITVYFFRINQSPFQWSSVLEISGLVFIGVLITFLLMKVTLPSFR